jgi:hypothetical protein
MPQGQALFCYWLPVILSLGFNSAVRGAEPLEGFLEKHCVRCHGAQAQKGDLRFDRLSRDFKTAVDSHHWAEALDKVNSGEMPPKKEPCCVSRHSGLLCASSRHFSRCPSRLG